MPHVHLTEEELLHIEKFRAKNAATLGFNEGVSSTLTWIESRIAEETDDSEYSEKLSPILNDIFTQGRKLLPKEVRS